MSVISTLVDAMTITAPELNSKSMMDASTSGQLIENTTGRVGVIYSTVGTAGRPVFNKQHVRQWRMYAEFSWAVRTAIDIHRNFITMVEPVVSPVDYKKPMDEGVKKSIEDLFSQRMYDGDSYSDVKEQILEDYFVMSYGAAELLLKNNGKPYDMLVLDAAKIGFVQNWDGEKAKSGYPRYAELNQSRQVTRWLPDPNVMSLINRKRSYDNLGLSHIETLDMAVRALLSGDSNLLIELQSPAPSGALSLGEGIGPAVADEVRAKIANAAKWAFVVVSGTKDPKFIPFKQRDLKALDKQVWFVRQVCAIFGLPTAALAHSVDTTRANTETLMDEKAEGLKNSVKRIMMMENADIVSKFGPVSKHNCRINYPILNQKDQLKQAELTAIQLAKQPCITINEGRRAQGFDALDDPKADVILFNTSVGLVPMDRLDEIPITPTNMPTSDDSVDGEIVDEDTPPKKQLLP